MGVGSVKDLGSVSDTLESFFSSFFHSWSVRVPPTRVVFLPKSSHDDLPTSVNIRSTTMSEDPSEVLCRPAARRHTSCAFVESGTVLMGPDDLRGRELIRFFGEARLIWGDGFYCRCF